VHASRPEDAESFYDPADDKVYRHPTFYTMPEGAKYI
jgi:ring-1,2-phenylacetyl-CoA epoxidase subunit PaaB